MSWDRVISTTALRLVLVLVVGFELNGCAIFSSTSSEETAPLEVHRNYLRNGFHSKSTRGGNLGQPGDAPESPDRNRNIRLGRVPYGNARTMFEVHQPLLKFLSEVSGEKVVLKQYPTYAGLIDAIDRGEIQLAWMGPVSYVLAQDRLKKKSLRLEPLVKPQRFNASHYRGEIIVRKNSGYSRLSDLNGKSISFVDKNSSSGYFLQTAMLAAGGVVPEGITASNFVQDYGNVVKSVLYGKFDAGATFEGAYKLYLPKDKRGEIRSLAKSDPIPYEPICLITSGKDVSIIQKWRRWLLAAHRKEIVKALRIQKFLPANRKEYHGLANLVHQVLKQG